MDHNYIGRPKLPHAGPSRVPLRHIGPPIALYGGAQAVVFLDDAFLDPYVLAIRHLHLHLLPVLPHVQQHEDDYARNYAEVLYYALSIFSHTRIFALRARLLAAISSSPGIRGFRVMSLTSGGPSQRQ